MKDLFDLNSPPPRQAAPKKIPLPVATATITDTSVTEAEPTLLAMSGPEEMSVLGQSRPFTPTDRNHRKEIDR